MLISNKDSLVREDTAIDFDPVDPDQARTLSSAQVQGFNQNGYITPLEALSADEAQHNKTYFDRLLNELGSYRDGRDAYSIMNYHDQCRGIWQLAQHPKILDYVEDLVGPNIVCWTSHYFCKLPQDGKAVAWHQDATYWPIRPTRTVTVWLAVDHVDESNAPMQFIAGSHLLGEIPYQEADPSTVLRQEIPNASEYGHITSNVLPAGSISLHTSTLVHGSKPNTSLSKRRCGLTLRYIPPECGVLDYARRSLTHGIICRGNGGAWQHITEPQGEDLSPKSWHRKKTD